jgi:hypothetical protein
MKVMRTAMQMIPINQKKGCPAAWRFIGILTLMENTPEEMNQD